MIYSPILAAILVQVALLKDMHSLYAYPVEDDWNPGSYTNECYL